MKAHVKAMVDFWNDGVPTLDYGNNIRQVALEEGLRTPLHFRGLYLPISGHCSARGSVRSVVRPVGRSRGYLPDRSGDEGAVSRQHPSSQLAGHGKGADFVSGPAGAICWIGLGDRHRAGLRFNEMVANGELKAPVVIGRDHLDAGSVASPNRETEAMKDGSTPSATGLC